MSRLYTHPPAVFFMPHAIRNHVYLRPETVGLVMVEEAQHAAASRQRGRLGELLAAWTPGEVSTLTKALRILRDSYADCATAYREIQVVPRPPLVQRQLEYYDHGASVLDHCIACIEQCGRATGTK